jgi:hypothetical protein
MSNLRQLARGRECMVRIPGVCSYDTTTTVLAHLPGGGMGHKQPDLFGAWACSACHQWLDETWHRSGCSKADRDLTHLQAVIRTQAFLIEEGVIRW